MHPGSQKIHSSYYENYGEYYEQDYRRDHYDAYNERGQERYYKQQKPTPQHRNIPPYKKYEKQKNTPAQPKKPEENPNIDRSKPVNSLDIFGVFDQFCYKNDNLYREPQDGIITVRRAYHGDNPEIELVTIIDLCTLRNGKDLMAIEVA